MDVREKLVELVHKIYNDPRMEFCDLYEMNANADTIADIMIENGVTVQVEAKLYWKPVKPGEWHLTCSACDTHLGCREGAKHCPECGAKFVYPKAVTPQPPKGE